MILIFSTARDESTTDVIRWLHQLGCDQVCRVNATDQYFESNVNIHLDGEDFRFEVDDLQFHLSEISQLWYRKGTHWLADQFYQVSIADHQNLGRYLNNKIIKEQNKLSEYIHHILSTRIPVLGNEKNSDLNKMIVLSMAKEVGLMIPEFCVTNQKEHLVNYLNSSSVITKSISDGLYLFDTQGSKNGYFSYTEQVTLGDVSTLEDRFAPSFVQHMIDKHYEVRIFYLEDKFYSMAILSQADHQTKTDYRKYNDKKPNRFVPYKCPVVIEEKLRRLFDKLDLNTGSIDLIVDKQGIYYFLEINPVGQFGMVSEPCNYYLERKVAETLMAHE